MRCGSIRDYREVETMLGYAGAGNPPETARQIEIGVQGLDNRAPAGKLRAFFVPYSKLRDTCARKLSPRTPGVAAHVVLLVTPVVATEPA